MARYSSKNNTGEEKEMKDKWDTTFTMALRKMFKMVGERYPNPKLTALKDWFMLHEWTEEKQDEFRAWLVKLIEKRHPWLTKHKVELEASMFILMYGWKTLWKERK